MSRKKKLRYILAGGGTAGHINPALSVARVLREHDPEAEIFFLTTAKGLEESMVREAGFSSLHITAGSLPERALGWPAFLLSTAVGFFRALGHLIRHRPGAVLGTGGYVMVPLCLAAVLLRIPLFLHEQNAYPGRANRLFSRFAKGICLSFSGSERFFSHRSKQFKFTGNPIASEFFSQQAGAARAKLCLPAETELVLLMGGSLGSKAINLAVQEIPDCPAWKELSQKHPGLRIVLSSGKINHRFLEQQKTNDPHIDIHPYLDSRLWMPAADLLIGRSGAGFLMETAACGKASILIPYPQAADDHQRLNAESFQRAGASRVLPESELTGERLLSEMQNLLEDREELKRMSASALALAKPRAAEDIAGILEDEVRR